MLSFVATSVSPAGFLIHRCYELNGLFDRFFECDFLCKLLRKNILMCS